MPLSAGTRLGPYEIVEPIGAGGMGEVYRARDTKLNRDVAIKVLLAAVANDPDRMERFSRELQMLASLNLNHQSSVIRHQAVRGRGRSLERFSFPCSAKASAERTPLA